MISAAFIIWFSAFLGFWAFVWKLITWGSDALHRFVERNRDR